MIERQTINGREASIAYVKRDWTPCGKDEAELVKVLFEDGEMLILVPEKKADDQAQP